MIKVKRYSEKPTLFWSYVLSIFFKSGWFFNILCPSHHICKIGTYWDQVMNLWISATLNVQLRFSFLTLFHAHILLDELFPFLGNWVHICCKKNENQLKQLFVCSVILNCMCLFRVAEFHELYFRTKRHFFVN